MIILYNIIILAVKRSTLPTCIYTLLNEFEHPHVLSGEIYATRHVPRHTVYDFYSMNNSR